MLINRLIMTLKNNTYNNNNNNSYHLLSTESAILLSNYTLSPARL